MKIPPGIKIYGDTSFRDKKCRKEEAEQKEYFGWLKEKRPSLYAIAIHPKNEGKRTPQQIARDRANGSLNTGASDIIIPAILPFLCEVKRKDHTLSSISGDQMDYLMAADRAGAFVCIALGCAAAIEATLEWEVLRKELIDKITCR